VGPALFPHPLRDSSFRRWLEDTGEIFGTSFTAGSEVFPPRFFYCANVSAKRRFLLEAGLFDERFPYEAWEDAELALRLARAGLRSTLVEGAVAWHDHPVTLPERCLNMEKAGASAAIFEGKHPGPHSWHAAVRRPAWQLSLALRWRRARAVVTRSPREREQAWRLELDRAFASGYQRARRRAAGVLRSS
jgi:GT2 family glycosyltransferase